MAFGECERLCCSRRCDIDEVELDVWNPLFPVGLSRGLCAGVTNGVWSGVGLRDSWLKEGEDGAVD